MAMVISEQKKKERQETENVLKKMEQRYEENEQKLEELGVEQKEDRRMIKKLGDSYVRMSVNYESEGISEDLWKKLGKKLDEMDRDKKGYIMSYKERWVRIRALKKDQEELENQIGMTKMYLKWYKWDEAEQEKDKVNLFSNTIEHFQTLSNILQYIKHT